jgi:hypothetical protein
VPNFRVFIQQKFGEAYVKPALAVDKREVSHKVEKALG